MMFLIKGTDRFRGFSDCFFNSSLLNVPGSFAGRINNSANIGMTSPDIAARWNEENPDNPIVLEPAPES